MSQFSVFHFSARCIFAHFCYFLNQKEHSIRLYSISHFRFHILPVISPALLAIHAPLPSSPRPLYKFIQYVYYSSTFLHKSHAKSLIQPKREPRPGTPLRGSTDASRLSEGGPGAGAPHGNLAGPRQPLVPFPCGKGTRTSADVRNSLKQPPAPARVPPPPKTKEKRPALVRQVVSIV